MASVRVASTGRMLAEQVEFATGFLDRAVGLLGRKALPSGTALFLSPCDSVHMLFMRFPIDVVFLDSENRIVKVVERLAPWKVAFGGTRASHVLEIPAGAARSAAIEVGEKLLFENGVS